MMHVAGNPSIPVSYHTRPRTPQCGCKGMMAPPFGNREERICQRGFGVSVPWQHFLPVATSTPSPPWSSVSIVWEDPGVLNLLRHQQMDGVPRWPSPFSSVVLAALS